MASSSSSSSFSAAALNQRLKEGGKTLLNPYNSVDELLKRLDNMDKLLQLVEQTQQDGVEETRRADVEEALQPLKNALIVDELLKNDDLNVKIYVICCICEILRITAPDHPYKDDKMREIFQLLIMIFGKFSSLEGRSYSKVVSVVDYVDNLQLCLPMWDCDDAFIVEMFRIFLHTIHSTARADLPPSLISNMENIMTSILNCEEEDVPVELFSILLDSLKRENENTAPLSYSMAGKVFTNCAVNMKRHLSTARLMDLALDDYAEIVARVCKDAKEDDGTGAARTPKTTEESLKDASSSKLLSANDQIKQLNISDATHCSQTEDPDATKTAQEESNAEVVAAPTLREANRKLSDATRCSQTEDPDAAKTVPEESNVEAVSELDKKVSDATHCSQSEDPDVSKTVQEDAEAVSAPKTNEDTRKDGNSLTSLIHCDQIKLQKNSHSRTNAGLIMSDAVGLVQQQLDQGAVSVSEKRRRKPNSLMKLEEGYDWTHSEGKYIYLPPLRRKYYKKEIGCSSKSTVSPILCAPSVHGKEAQTSSDSETLSQCFPKKKRSKLRKPSKEAIMLNEVSDLESLSDSARERLSVHIADRKQKSDTVATEHTHEKSQLKTLSPLSIPNTLAQEFDEAIKGKRKRKHTPLKEEVSKYTRNVKENGELYVGSKTQMPADNMSDNNAVDSSKPPLKKHKVSNVASSEDVSISDNAKLKNVKIKSKSEKASNISRVEDASTSSGHKLKNVRTNSKSEKGKAKDPVTPATLKVKLPSLKLQGRTTSKSVERTKGKKLLADSIKASAMFSVQVGNNESSEKVDVHGYSVKASVAPILEAIITKYGDIAATCRYKSPTVRASLLEVVCGVIHRLKNYDVTVDINAMKSEISDAVEAKLEVSWLENYLAAIIEEEETAKRSSEARKNSFLILSEAKMELKQRQAQVVQAQLKLQKTEKAVEVLKQVTKKIDEDIMDNVAKEKCWLKRLDELLGNL